MPRERRLYLDVPYREKDQAKAIGARWDPERRQWWVDPQRVSDKDVARWLTASAVVVGPEDTDGPTVRVRLLGLGQFCWRCKRATTALVGLLPVRSSNVDNMLACMDERVLSLAAGALPENVRQSRQVGRIAARYSKTEGRRYLSNGCFHCDALLGRFPLFANELRKCIEKYGLSGLTEITQADFPYESIRWQLVRANTWAGAVNELSPGAYLFDWQLDNGTAGGSWEFDLREWEP